MCHHVNCGSHCQKACKNARDCALLHLTKKYLMLASISVTELRGETLASVTLQSNLLPHLILTRGPGCAVDLSGHFDLRGLQWPLETGNIISLTKQNFLRYDTSPRAHLLFLCLRDALIVCTEGGNKQINF